MNNESAGSVSADLRAAGFCFRTEARLVRSGDFSGVFHVLSTPDGKQLDPAVVIYAPGKWREPARAHLAAERHAATMAGDGALDAAIHAVRRCNIRGAIKAPDLS